MATFSPTDGRSGRPSLLERKLRLQPHARKRAHDAKPQDSPPGGCPGRQRRACRERWSYRRAPASPRAGESHPRLFAGPTSLRLARARDATRPRPQGVRERMIAAERARERVEGSLIENRQRRVGSAGCTPAVAAPWPWPLSPERHPGPWRAIAPPRWARTRDATHARICARPRVTRVNAPRACPN